VTAKNRSLEPKPRNTSGLEPNSLLGEGSGRFCTNLTDGPFRKLLVRYEKLDRSFLALNHLAASSMTFRKIESEQNIIYG